MSVRSPIEADEAIAGGADIIDLKDPDRGSLGCAGREMMDSVAGSGRPITAALGECLEWQDVEAFDLPDNVSAVKLGLAGVSERPDWQDDWLNVRRRFQEQSGRPLQWVAVAYVDSTVSKSPEVSAVARAAIETGCAGLLLDTFEKRAGRLFDYIDERRLDELGRSMHAAGLFLAAAGRVAIADVSRLIPLPVDVIAVRSAACAGDDRKNAIRADRVTACLAALRQTPLRLSGAC